jgi:hypothetical protein
MQEQDKTKKEKGRNRSATNVTVSNVDPQKDTPPNKWKALKLRNPFLPKPKVNKYDDDLLHPNYTAKFDYEATSGSELSFRKGDQMHIKSKGKGKTWQASINGKEGTIPKSHVTALDDEE